jgi:hypothetical protein
MIQHQEQLVRVSLSYPYCGGRGNHTFDTSLGVEVVKKKQNEVEP